MSTPNLYDILSQKLEQKRKDHPSFRLMKIDDRLFPNAQTKHSTLELEARNSNDEIKTVAEIVAESWEKGDKNHLMIEGEGGIGKTVTLLSIPDKFTPSPEPFPSIYIPLHEVKGDFDTIEKYIRKRVLSNKEHLYEQLLNLIEQPWDKGPQLLLLLDGFNEIAAENRQTISEDIKYWSEFQGIQIVTSSRYDIHTYVALSYDYSAIKLQPLSNTTVEAYLKSMKVRIPTDSAVKELITIPLLLTLYVKTELILEQRETDSAEFKEVKNAGSIVWNYLQCELWSFGKEDEDAKNAIIAMEFVAPYMAWQMQQNSLFFLNQEQFNKYLENAYKLLGSHFNKPVDFRFHIQNALQKADGMPPLKLIRNLLEKQLCLFVKNGNSYKLMHQQFRDALAAMHLINSIYLSGDSRPIEWNSIIDHYVMQFVVDLISEDEANRLWDQNKTSPQLETATLNQMESQRRLNNCDFSKLDFSGIDLSNISLFPYRVGNTMLKLPTDADAMKEVKISEKTFSSEVHKGSVNALALTSDGKRIVSGSDDNTIRVWDLDTGACLKTLEGHTSSVKAVALTSDGKRIVSGSGDKTIRVWDLETGTCLKTLEGHRDFLHAVALTSDDKRIVSVSWDSTIRVWDFETGSCLKTLKGHTSSVNAVALTSDGKRIVSGSGDKTIRVWDLETGVCLKILEGHWGFVTSLALTSDGKRIVSGSSDETIRVWDLETGACLNALKVHDYVTSLALTSDGKLIVIVLDNPTIRVWDLETGACLQTLEGHWGFVTALALTSDGKRIVSGSWDHTICVWDLDTGSCLKALEGYENCVKAVALTSDGKCIVSGSWDRTIRVWDLDTGSCLKTLEGYTDSVYAVALSSDGKHIVNGSRDRTIRVWDLDTGSCLKTLEGHANSVYAIALSSDGKRIVSGSEDRTICVWNLETGACLKTLEEHTYGVAAVAVTSDGKRIVSGSRDHTIRVWDMETGACLKTLEGHTSSVEAVAETSDSKHIVSGSLDNTIRIWDLKTGACLKTLEGHDDWVNAVAVTTDGKRIVSGSRDHTIRVWDMKTGTRLKTLKGHTNDVNAVAVTSDGKRIVSGSDDHTIRVWDMESGECLTTIYPLPLSFVGLDFSKAIISTPELKEQLRQNGAIV